MKTIGPVAKNPVHHALPLLLVGLLGTLGCSGGPDSAESTAALATTPGAAPSVESRTSEIPTFNSQAQAFTFTQLCRVLTEDGVNLGGASVRCSDKGAGVVQFEISKGDLAASMLANAADKLAIEHAGSDEIHEYKNNLGQSLRVKFDFVASGTHRVADGTFIDGSYRGDIFVKNDDGSFRFGYYFNAQLSQ